MTDVAWRISVDAEKANAEMDRVRSSVLSLGGAEDKLTTSTAATTRAIEEQGVAASSTSAAMTTHTKATADASEKQVTFRERVGKSADVLGKQAAAISLVSSSLGENNGQVGKAVAGAGQMAAAFGAGGPYAAALVAGMALVSMFSTHLKELTAAQEASFQATFSAGDKVVSQRMRLERELSEMRKAVAGPETVAQAFERTQKDIDTAVQNLADARVRLNAERTHLDDGHDDRVAGLNLEISQYGRIIAALESMQGLELRRTATSALPKPSAASPKTPAKETAPLLDLYGDSKESLASFIDAERERDAIAQTSAEEQQARSKMLYEEYEALDKKRTSIFDEQSKKRKAIAKNEAQSQAQTMSGYATTAAGIAAGASTQLVADIIGNQEMALERFGVTIMAQAGQALVSYGTQALGAAALSASLGLFPVAATQLATGGVLLAAGVGLGGVAAGLGSLMSPPGGGSDRGAPSRSSTGSGGGSGSGGGGGGTSVTIVYNGASGPTADLGARGVVDAQDRAARRNLGRTSDR